MSDTPNPGIIGEIVEGMHKLEEKVEHLIHPEAEQAPEVATPGESSASVITSASTIAESSSSGASSESPAEDPNAAAFPVVSIDNFLRERIQAIKGHLQGFEESSRQKILAELQTIERWL